MDGTVTSLHLPVWIIYRLAGALKAIIRTLSITALIIFDF